MSEGEGGQGEKRLFKWGWFVIFKKGSRIQGFEGSSELLGNYKKLKV